MNQSKTALSRGKNLKNPVLSSPENLICVVMRCRNDACANAMFLGFTSIFPLNIFSQCSTYGGVVQRYSVVIHYILLHLGGF